LRAPHTIGVLSHLVPLGEVTFHELLKDFASCRGVLRFDPELIPTHQEDDRSDRY